MKTRILRQLHKLINRRLVTSCILMMTLGVTQAALAEYQPPPDQKPPSGYSDTSGMRGGCQTNGGRSVTLLAPITHVGRTTSSHPTFTWFVHENQSAPIEFSLWELDTNIHPKKLSNYTQKVPSSSGITRLSLSKQLPGLSLGKRYLWQLQILCNNQRPSQNLIARAEIEFVHAPQTLLSSLSATSDRLQKANLYASAGMWYDALGEALTPRVNPQLGRIAATLLEDLAKLEKPGQSTDLSSIAMSDR